MKVGTACSILKEWTKPYFKRTVRLWRPYIVLELKQWSWIHMMNCCTEVSKQ